MKLTVTMRVQGAHVDITCPQISDATTVKNCLIVDDTYAAIIDLGRTWEEIGREIHAQLPTCREVVPFAVPVADHERIPMFILHYLREIQETYRPHRWWHVVSWLSDLLLEWPDYDRLPRSDQETISSNLRWLHLRQLNGRPPLPERRTLQRTLNEAGLLVLPLVLVWTIVVALLR
ncbi:MAG TPA: hypothetical protein VGE07_22905 [Herpetosiphonaceae bacterium]